MSETNSRRTFIRNSGVALTAALAAGSAVATPVDDAAQRLALLEDSNAIRALQQRYFSLLEQRADVSALFCSSAAFAASALPALVLDSRHDGENIVVAADRQRATASFRSRLQLGIPIAGDSTLQQMARQQGQSEQQWREQGTYEVEYVKLGAAWLISALRYHTA